MTLTEQINRERDAIDGYEKAIKEARKALWETHFVATHDERRRHEDGSLEDREHWERRRARNRAAYENRDRLVEHLAKKKQAHAHLLNRLKDHKAEWKEEQAAKRDGPYDKGSIKIVTFDSKPCVEDLAYWLYRARTEGAGGQKWLGVLVSGWRSPEYSEQLCFGICNHPTCPGLCAGRTSNHTKLTYPGPAGDITDYIRGEEVLIDLGSGYFNNLPRDLVHMSHSGG